MNPSLDTVLQNTAVWRGYDPASGQVGVRHPTGWPRLDAALAGGGWPLGTLIECLLPSYGIGELRLLLPVLRQLLRRTPEQAPRWLTWVSPPHEPYPPALAQSGIDPACLLQIRAQTSADRLWATEQVLRSGRAAALLCWLDSVEDRWLRRLKLAAEGQPTLLIAFRPSAHRHVTSAASLRLALQVEDGRLDLTVLKERGRSPSRVSNVLSG